MWLCQFIDLLKFETRPSFLLNFGKANYLQRVWFVLFATSLHQLGIKLGESFVKVWYFVALKFLIFSSRLCPLMKNVSPVVCTSFCVFGFTGVFWFLNKLFIDFNKAGSDCCRKILMCNSVAKQL